MHDRCGTTFLVFVLTISIICFAVFEALAGVPLKMAIPNKTVYNVVRILCKLAILPVVAGISYELLKVLSKTQSKWVYPLKAPGLLLQRLTTKEPTDDMLEVAITAFKTVMEMDKDESIKEQTFIVPKKCCEVTGEVKKELASIGITEDAEAEWIVSLALGIKRDEVYSDKQGLPMWY